MKVCYMISKSYYLILTDTDNNFASGKTFLSVNCTGHSFYTDEIKACTSRHDYYLIYLYSGIIFVRNPAVEIQMCPGDMIIFKPECNFDYFKPQGINTEYYWVHFTGYGAAEIFKQCGLETNFIMTPGNHECICEDFRKLFETFLSRDRFFEVESAHRLSSLLIDIGKCISGQITDAPQNYSRINRSLSYIHDNISKAVQVRLLADAEHMSVSHFRAVFHKITGLSPQEYIILSKLNYSCELMRQTDMSIKEIGTAVGYYDPQYFSRIFSRHFGLSPGAYKAQNKQQ
jgi:AraC family transcriptional regulator of arabinose operon